MKSGAFVRSWRGAGARRSPRPAEWRSRSTRSTRGLGARALHALGVKTGKDVILTSRVRPVAVLAGDDAQIDELGVVYGVNPWKKVRHGHVVFVPMARSSQRSRKATRANSKPRRPLTRAPRLVSYGFESRAPDVLEHTPVRAEVGQPAREVERPGREHLCAAALVVGHHVHASRGRACAGSPAGKHACAAAARPTSACRTRCRTSARASSPLVDAGEGPGGAAVGA